jgi:hypothetical protein
MKHAFPIWFLLLFAGVLFADETGDVIPSESVPPEQARFFESKIRPLLAEHCWKCHGPTEQKGGLRLDSHERVLAGGESGAAISLDKPKESLLLAAVRYESLEMPPDGKLPDEQIALLAQWIEMGAPWPKSDLSAASDTDRTFTDADRQWWAWQKVVDPPVPQVADDGWIRNDVDRFILAKLAEQNLKPANEADRATLIRRLSFDLIGLPPSPEEVDAFVSDRDPQGYERLVDRLLESPRYGERWARHWLDLVRYADSDGYRIDHYRPNAWRYRDYVIASLNSDKPYDQFVREQIAGDELFPGDSQALIATGYLAHGIYEYNARDVQGQWDNILNEITDTTADVFLGLGLQCARCHDHKFDPLLQKDYFALRAFFEPMALNIDQPVVPIAEREVHRLAMAEYERQTAALRVKLFSLESPYRKAAEETATEKFPPEMKQIIRKSQGERSPHEQQLAELALRQVDYEYANLDAKFKPEDKEPIATVRSELAKFDAMRPKPLPVALSARDVSASSPKTIIPKKEIEVSPGIPSILGETSLEIVPTSGNSSGRRTALANWLSQRDNALSTRVIVNRVWQYHFGRGLSPISSDFGKLGEQPSHPELLDWLTTRFLDGGWRLKPLHRLIVTSAAYRQSTAHAEFANQSSRDPANRWYWRGNTRRLEAEQIRDAILATSGRLDLNAGGAGVMPDQPRRTIYTRVMRNSRDPLLDVFDLPLFFSSSPMRDSTTTPIQSLLLFNNQELLKYGEALAQRVAIAKGITPGMGTQDKASLVRDACRIAWGRDPNERELEKGIAFLDKQTAEAEAVSKSTDDPQWRAFVDFCHVLLNSNQFLYVH